MMRASKIVSATLATMIGIGAASAAEVVNGFGSDVPLSRVVDQIVPDGFNVIYGDGVDESSRISWTGGDVWQMVLGKSAEAHGFSVSISDQEVYIGKRFTPPQASLSPSPSHGATASAPSQMGGGGFVIVSPDRQASQPPQTAQTPPPSPPVSGAALPSIDGANYETQAAREPAAEPARRTWSSEPRYIPEPPTALPDIDEPAVYREENPVKDVVDEHITASKAVDLNSMEPDMVVSSTQTWVVEPAEYLRTIMEDWAESAGWTLVWNSDYDYPMQAGAKFYGDFLEATGELVRSLKDARPALTVSFYKGNRVVVITNEAADEVN